MRHKRCIILSQSDYHLRAGDVPNGALLFEGEFTGYEMTEGGEFIVYEVTEEQINEQN